MKHYIRIRVAENIGEMMLLFINNNKDEVKKSFQFM